MRLFKLFSFWLTLFAIAICLLNLSGNDDKNLLLFLTSPILWPLESYSSFINRFISEHMLLWLDYFLNVFFWFCLGLTIDSIVHSSIRKKLLTYLTRISIVSFVLILISVVFYMYQNSEKEISAILKHPDQYNEHSIRFAVVKATEDGYGDKYINEMALILQSTTSEEIYRSTVYSLGLIRKPSAIKAIIEHHKDSEDIIYASLSMNEQTVITMLDENQPQDMIIAGIEASRLLGFSSFVQPLSKIADNDPSKETQEKAAKVLEQITLNPKMNNPKYNMD